MNKTSMSHFYFLWSVEVIDLVTTLDFFSLSTLFFWLVEEGSDLRDSCCSKEEKAKRLLILCMLGIIQKKKQVAESIM